MTTWRKRNRQLNVVEIPFSSMTILPAAPGTCPVCATKHDPDQPHNQQSLYYQMSFYQQCGRWPTWEDAMAHCDAETKRLWTEELTKRGVALGQVGGECS